VLQKEEEEEDEEPYKYNCDPRYIPLFSILNIQYVMKLWAHYPVFYNRVFR